MIEIKEVHSMTQYLELLSDSLKIYMEEERLYRAYEDACFASDDNKRLALLWLKIESAGSYTSLNQDNIIDYLLRVGVDLDRYSRRKTQGYSLDMKRVVTPLIEANVAPELLTAYREFRTFTSYANSLRSLVQTNTKRVTTVSGRILREFNTHIQERDNLRVYYSDIAVVSVPKIFSNMITTKDDGHYIAWCDYPQADWRFAYNLFIRDENNAQEMLKSTDAYEGLARMVEGDKFDLEAFKEKRKEFKVHCLKVFYNSKDNAPVPSAIRAFFHSCPKYKRLLYDLGILYHFKLPIPCTSYFGFEQLIPEGAYPDAFISKALNTPIQTFTSHIVNETVFSVLERFWELGYSKEDINIYYVRHDEPLFVFSPKVLKDAWVFKECSEIYIPGFTPIHLDFHFGRYYQEEDEVITKQVEQAIESSTHEYFMADAGDANHEADDYWPFPSVESVYLQVFVVDGNAIVEVYNYRNGKRTSITVAPGEPYDIVVRAFNGGLLRWLGNPRYVLARTAGYDYMDYIGPDGETLLKLVDRPDTNVMVSR